MFAGSFRGITQTVPLAIYERFSTDFTGALALSAVLGRGLGGAADGGQAAERHGLARRCCALRRGRGSGASTSTSRSRRRPAAASRSPARPGRARPRSCAWSRASCGRDRGRVLCGDEVWLDTGARHRRPARGAALRLPLPGVRAVRPPARVAERRLRAARHPARRAAAARARAARALRRRRARRRAAAHAVGRGAPARGARPRGRAAARAALLLDEPLAALDPRTRAAAGRELAALLRDAEVPALLVTHDFTEAALLGDRVGDRRRAAA